MSDLIFITGATGNVGAEIVRQLSDREHRVRVAQRNLQRSRNWSPSSNVEYTEFDFTQPQTFAQAFQGVKRVFLMRPPALSQVKTYMYPAIDSAIASGVEQIVFLSLLGAESNPIVPHAKVEKYIQSVGIPYTFLRASFFMQNLSTTHRQDIQERKEIVLPAGKGKTSFIDVRDIAAVGVKALTESGHSDHAYSLTGSEALDYYQVAEVFTEVLGKPITYTNPSIIKFALSLYKRGLDIQFIAVMIGIYTTAKLGFAGKLTTDTQDILQRAPISMRQFVEDYRDCWVKPTS
ncbi:SDR family oxidoreductase [Chlorogloea sp. CCALA 695]|uniref:SDR family oxidoreductase n=1 Tax=Chlorogloea sp. CCALA 695 TaxID=2107693 RepID=UPI000D04DF97|nr:SDR family oxidoreductase [Chlorogloea sp. CCALA 695]PSB28752.1 NAD(P)-dependent oxidoreductase [Chlorogloea sp. CCALA 695]